MRKMSRKRRLTLVALAVGGLGGAAFTVMTVKDQTYVPSSEYVPVGNPNREVAVVYYSRSGHSEAVAREVARTLNAPIARLPPVSPTSRRRSHVVVFGEPFQRFYG